MNTNNTVIIVAVIVVLGIGGAYFYTHRPHQDNAKQQQDQIRQQQLDKNAAMQSNQNSSSQSGVTALKAYINAGQSVTCTYSFDADAQTAHQGTFYYDGTSKQYRIEDTMHTASSTYDSHMIFTTDAVYVWGSQPSGSLAYKMTADMLGDTNPINAIEHAGEAPQQRGAQENTAVNATYDCQPGAVDASQFVPPTDIAFTDMSAMMQGNLRQMQQLQL